MYKAVEQFGPRWPQPTVPKECLKPDGKFDFEKCTEDSAIPKGSVTMPPLGRAELEAFADSVKSNADPADIALLMNLARGLK
jgi:hypothetical protein